MKNINRKRFICCRGQDREFSAKQEKEQKSDMESMKQYFCCIMMSKGGHSLLRSGHYCGEKNGFERFDQGACLADVEEILAYELQVHRPIRIERRR